MAAEAKPRVLCVMQLPPPVHGVTAVNKSVASSELLRERFDLEIIPLRFATSIEDVGRVSIRKLTLAASTGLRLGWALAAHRPHGVYFTLAPRGVAFARDCAYVALMKIFGVPRIYHLHAGGIAEQLSSRWKRALYRWAFRGAWVIHLSPRLDGDTASIVDEARVLHVPNGVPDTSRVERNQAGTPRVLFLANMIAEKGPLQLLRALALVRANGVAFEATFAGARYNDSCVEDFEAEVARLDLAGCVRYVGPAYGDDKERLFHSHHVFVCPTLRDAFPLVVLEAMQQALPVVATREGAIPDMIDDNLTGFVVDKNDTEAMAAKLTVLLQDGRLRSEMGKRARARFLERYTLLQFEQHLHDALSTWLRAS